MFCVILPFPDPQKLGKVMLLCRGTPVTSVLQGESKKVASVIARPEQGTVSKMTMITLKNRLGGRLHIGGQFKFHLGLLWLTGVLIRWVLHGPIQNGMVVSGTPVADNLSIMTLMESDRKSKPLFKTFPLQHWSLWLKKHLHWCCTCSVRFKFYHPLR